ncbi:MAG: hypothetical protein A3H51_02085 [Candidatus Spechtbacteria bacterium RIFCSPLOWO2_02_FULL_38_8]|uniref:3D domain-containing protein n=1 Tax=Candidatus Spechtbacteria bacterium RIFCSPLOWO2_02_FULL_38_8 TaxID=1802164 RepID=A0A1G2HHX2_9BACT|nr:MAG: hypothetical protein A3H51_02085 [Candidatus Spechtbacteria bacterium RIFCSPLOWO2_02_FULL_38_8]
MANLSVPFLRNQERGKQLKLEFGDYSPQAKKIKFLEISVKIFTVVLVFSVVFSAHFAIAYDSNTAKISSLLNAEQYKKVADSYTEGNFATEVQITSYIVAQSAIFVPPVPPAEKQENANQRLWVSVTAYSSTLDQTDFSPFVTASGTQVRDGVVAANFLPIGTKIKIPSMFGDKVFVVEDRMNARYWHRVDIWMPTRYDALQFGIRTLQIEIV